MDFMIQWFWLVKLSASLLLLYVLYKAIWVNKFKSKLWNIFGGALLLFLLISPIKLDVNTKAQTDRVNAHIAETYKKLPPMIKDDSFQEKSSNVEGITEDYLK